MTGWEDAWRYTAALPPGTPQWVVAVVALLCIYVIVIVPSSTVISFLERKLSADLQARVGPNRAGPAGIFQPVADLFKLLQKEGTQDFSWRDTLWFAVQTMALYSTVAALPLGSLFLLVDTDMSFFLPFWATLVLALSTMLLGLSQASVPGWLGGVRIATQALAGAFPALISVICVGLRAGGFRWSVLAGSQGPSPLHWTIFNSPPFGLLAFGVFVVSGMVLLAVPPLDGGLSVPDIHGGVASHLYGRRLSMFRLSRFYGFLLWSIIASVLFLGGWSLPEAVANALRDSESWRVLQFMELMVLMLKTFVLMLLILLVASVTPRLRSDQVTDLAWKVLSPFSLLALAGTAIWMGWLALR